MATVELDAHRKAQATINEAQAQASALRTDTARWMEKVAGGYEQMRETVHACADAVSDADARLSDGAEELRELRARAGGKAEALCHE